MQLETKQDPYQGRDKLDLYAESLYLYFVLVRFPNNAHGIKKQPLHVLFSAYGLNMRVCSGLQERCEYERTACD